MLRCSWQVVTSPAVNHSSPLPVMTASPLACVGGWTSRLMVHVRTVPTRQQQCTLSSFCVVLHRSCSDIRQERITGLISDMLFASVLPVSLVESAEMSAVAHRLNGAVSKLFLTGLLIDIRRAVRCGRQAWLMTVSVAWVDAREKMSLCPSIVSVFQTVPINHTFPRSYCLVVTRREVRVRTWMFAAHEWY